MNNVTLYIKHTEKESNERDNRKHTHIMREKNICIYWLEEREKKILFDSCAYSVSC